MKQVKVHVSGVAKSGKSTVALVIEQALRDAGYDVKLVPGLVTEDSTLSKAERLARLPEIAAGTEIILEETQLARGARFDF